MTEKRTRARLTAEVAALIIGKYPVAWNAKEIALALKAHRRTVERILADLVAPGSSKNAITRIPWKRPRSHRFTAPSGTCGRRSTSNRLSHGIHIN